MNILVLNYEYPPIGSGGGIISKYIVDNLARKNHKVTVITTWFKGLPEFDEEENIKIYRLDSKRKKAYKSNPREMLDWAKKSKSFLNELALLKKFDICLANFAIPGGLTAKFLYKKFNIPYCIISHGHDIPWVKPVFMYFYHALCYFKIKNICKNSTYNFVQTKMMKKNIDRFIGKKLSKKNILIPNGCDKELFNSVENKHSNSKILFVGRLVKQKNPILFLKALNILNKKGINFNAKILGDGPLKSKLQKYITGCNLEKKVELKGKLNNKEVIKEYKESGIFVNTSLSEGMSIAILEAIFSGLYILATPASGNQELIKEYGKGEIFNFNDYNELAEMLITIINSNQSLNFINEKFRERYDWKNIVDEYEIYLKKSIAINI